MGRGKAVALLNLAFLLVFFFNAGEFQIPVSSRVGPVLHSAKVWFDFLPFLSAPSLQELIPELPQAQPEQHSHTRLGEKKGNGIYWHLL